MRAPREHCNAGHVDRHGEGWRKQVGVVEPGDTMERHGDFLDWTPPLSTLLATVRNLLRHAAPCDLQRYERAMNLMHLPKGIDRAAGRRRDSMLPHLYADSQSPSSRARTTASVLLRT